MKNEEITRNTDYIQYQPMEVRMKAKRKRLSRKLLPCPFCGAEVKRTKGIVMGTITFVCGTCGADVMFYGAEYDPKASEAWNRRVEKE